MTQRCKHTDSTQYKKCTTIQSSADMRHTWQSDVNNRSNFDKYNNKMYNDHYSDIDRHSKCHRRSVLQNRHYMLLLVASTFQRRNFVR